MRRTFTGEPCPHMPHLYKTEAAHLAHNERNRAYYARTQDERGPRQFNTYPLRLRLQRLLATIKQRCKRPGRYAEKGIQCFLNYDDLFFLWHRDAADKMKRPSIDREENDGPYVRSNCRFIELVENIQRGVVVRDSERQAHPPTPLRVQRERKAG